MAIAKRFKISHDEVFPHGAFLVSLVSPVYDFERSTRDHKVQQLDPDASRAARTVVVKFMAKTQPVPPANDTGMPITPVVFHGLTALPYVEKVSEDFSRVAWSFKADAMDPVKGQAAGNPNPVRRPDRAWPRTWSPGRRPWAWASRSSPEPWPRGSGTSRNSTPRSPSSASVWATSPTRTCSPRSPRRAAPSVPPAAGSLTPSPSSARTSDMRGGRVIDWSDADPRVLAALEGADPGRFLGQSDDQSDDLKGRHDAR